MRFARSSSGGSSGRRRRRGGGRSGVRRGGRAFRCPGGRIPRPRRVAGGIGLELDRLALRVGARLRQGFRLLLGDHDIAALEGVVVELAQRLRPGLTGGAATAGRVVLLAVAEGIRQLGIGSAAARHRLGDVLAGIAVAVERDFGGRAQALAEPLILVKFGRHRGVGDREVIAVAGPHTNRAVGPGPAQRSVGGGPERRADSEQGLEEATRRGRILPVLRTAIVLAERDQDRAALAFAVGAVALRALKIAHEAVEVRPDLLDLVVELTALRRLAAEQGEEAAARATHPLGLLTEAVELALLLADDLLVAPDLLGARRVDGAAIDPGKLALEPQAGLVARRRPWNGGGGRCELCRCRSGESQEQQRDGAQSARRFGDRCFNHGTGARPEARNRGSSAAMVSKV